MDMELLRGRAAAHGFEYAYLLPLRLPEDWIAAVTGTERERMAFDVAARYPDGRSVLLLVYPYAPFDESERISAYYVASNAGYFAAKQLADELNAHGIYAERAELPARAIAAANGIGAVGKNGLLRLGAHGSRIALYTLVTSLAPEAGFSVPPTPPCGSCNACASACPTAAIGGALDVKRCMRSHMNSAAHPHDVMEKQRFYIGCEACMFACPLNPMDRAEVPAAVREAFELRRLILGDTKAARALVGRNMGANGQLTAEAMVFAAREGLYQAEIREAAGITSFPAVKRAAEWALHKYF